MPYIQSSNRADIDRELELLIQRLKREPDELLDGLLNYAISRIVAGTLEQAGWRYRRIARAIAAFETAKMEFYRRIAAPYEDQAIKINGDIPEYE